MMYLDAKQTINTTQLYIGDTARLQCTFESDADFLRSAFVSQTERKLSSDYFTGTVDINDCEIKTVTLSQKSEGNYVFTVDFVCWKTKTIKLPDFDLSSAFGDKELNLGLQFNVVEVQSLIENENITELEGQISPILLPGTTYRIYGLIFAGLVLFIILVLCILKFKSISAFVLKVSRKLKFFVNKKIVQKKLGKIRDDNEISAHDAAEQMQTLVRNYLEVRFEYPFTRTVTSEIIQAFSKTVDSDFIDYKIEYCSEIASVFARTDFLRYSKDSKFEADEKQQLVNRLIEAINGIEKPVKIKKDRTEEIR